jgi:hypothetical protein
MSVRGYHVRGMFLAVISTFNPNTYRPNYWPKAR